MAEFKLGCPCGFVTADPQAFLDHCAQTDHIELPPGDLPQLLEMLGVVQRAAAGEPLPEGAEIRPLSEDEIIMDEELADDDKQAILTSLAELQTREGHKRKES